MCGQACMFRASIGGRVVASVDLSLKLHGKIARLPSFLPPKREVAFSLDLQIDNTMIQFT